MGNSEFFKNRKEAAVWLKEGGYPVSQSKFYNDCPGVIPVNEDKTVSKFLVMQYGIAQQRKVAGVDGVSIVVSAQAAEADLRKKEADADIAERKASRMAREEDEDWLHAADAWAMLAGLINRMRAASRHHVYSSRREIVEMVKGNQDYADAAYQMIEGLLDEAYNEVAGKGKVEVRF